MKYMVMECHLSYAVVLDEEGRFLKAANQHYEAGQVVTEIIEMQTPQPAAVKKKSHKGVYSLAALAACLILAATAVFQTGRIPYASVYMAINPEVRIDVNRNDIAVGLKGINADGEELIRGYSFKKKALDLVMDELVDRAIDMGYLHEGGQISLTLDTDDKEWVISHSDTLTTHLNEHLSEKMTVIIEVSDKNDRTNQVTIPVGPDKSGYGEAGSDEAPDEDGEDDSDDGDSDDDDSDDNDSDDNDSDDDNSDDNDSDDDNSDDNDSDDDNSDDNDSDDDNSDDNDSDDDNSDDNDSDDDNSDDNDYDDEDD